MRYLTLFTLAILFAFGCRQVPSLERPHPTREVIAPVGEPAAEPVIQPLTAELTSDECANLMVSDREVFEVADIQNYGILYLLSTEIERSDQVIDLSIEILERLDLLAEKGVLQPEQLGEREAAQATLPSLKEWQAEQIQDYNEKMRQSGYRYCLAENLPPGANTVLPREYPNH